MILEGQTNGAGTNYKKKVMNCFIIPSSIRWEEIMKASMYVTISWLVQLVADLGSERQVVTRQISGTIYLQSIDTERNALCRK